MNPFYKNLALWLVITLMMIMLFKLFNQQHLAESSISYSEFLSMVENENVSEVVIQGQELYVTDTNRNRFKVFAPQDNDLIGTLRQKGVIISAKPPAENPWYMSVLVSWFPMIVLIGVWIFFMRQMQAGGGKAMSFGKSRARLLSDSPGKVTFADVAGIDEAKEELSEIVEFLKEPKKFTRLGGRIPKGVLLMGSPGTGKTLLARAIAGEAGVPFFSISGSDFVEMFVGVGASRVRDLFVQGKKNAPCIIFIDEIDAVGRHRGAGLGGGHDEREQTLNQLLVEMDGFESNEGVILISATNRPDVLDPALLRPGRFDRQVVVPMPDIKGRQKILQVHLKKTPVGDDVEILVLAKGTPGFSGADLENLVNEAALLAAKRNKEHIGMPDLEDAKDKVYMGLERKSKVIREEDKKNDGVPRGRPRPGGEVFTEHRYGQQDHHYSKGKGRRRYLVFTGRKRFQIQGPTGKRTVGGIRRKGGRRACFQPDFHRRIQRYQTGYGTGPADGAHLGNERKTRSSFLCKRGRAGLSGT